VRVAPRLGNDAIDVAAGDGAQDRLARRIELAPRDSEQALGAGRARDNLGQQRDAVHLGHAQVGEHHRHRVSRRPRAPVQQFERGAA
jgi:hypothetical protein